MAMKTLVIGASPNPMRYAYSAVEQLRWKDHEVIAVGQRKGRIEDVDILMDWPEEIAGLDTITLYIGPARQVHLPLPPLDHLGAARRDFEYAPRVSIDEGLERLKIWLSSQQL